MVLVIDDDDDIRETVADLIGWRGFEVTQAANGQEALALLQSSQVPCVILLDLVMPVMDGWQFLERLRGAPGLRDVPVVIVSGHARSHAPAGVTKVLHKPFDIEDLYAAVAEHCGST